jgi:hypothetical protein
VTGSRKIATTPSSASAAKNMVINNGRLMLKAVMFTNLLALAR